MVSSTDFLVDDAYRRVWCSPEQDRQKIVGPKRFSKRQGEIGNVKIGMRQYNMPTTGQWYHLFTIGDLLPEQVGMTTIVDKWVMVQGHCNATSLLIDLYIDKGLHIPSYRAYFLYTRTGQLILAILDSPKIAHFGLVQPWIRWRSNAWFDGGNVPKNGGIEINGTTPKTEAEFYQFQALYRASKAKLGYTWAFVNGVRVKDLNLTTLALGDYVEYVRDASVKEVLEIPVKDLKSFDSILDNRGKYLLPRPGLGSVIDYADDIDIYVLNYSLAAKYTGFYYNQNQPDAIRNVTHRDFSIAQMYLRKGIEEYWQWSYLSDLRVEVIVRHSGWIRELADEAHRIKELFKLDEDERLKVMLTQVAGVDVWRAANLENSAYPALMRAEMGTITRQMVEDAYGYNALSRLIGDTPFKITVTDKWVALPFGLIGESTVYEYDQSGLMTGWYIHDNSIEYPVRNTSTRYIEAYSGRGGIGLSTVYDTKTVPLEEGVDYRFYICNIANGVSLNNWSDCTGDLTKYSIANGVLSWGVDLKTHHVAVKNSKDFLSYSFDVNYRDDLLAFSVNVNEIKVGTTPAPGIMDIPPGEFDLFMNQHGLVEGIDYYVEWPQVCVCAKQYMVDGPIQEFVVRGRGFTHKDMTRYLPKDYGFVKYGELSHNGRFNVRDDKVTRIEIGGRLYSRDEVGFTEDGTTVSVDVRNGTPYRLTHPIVPMQGLAVKDTYTLLAEAEATDQAVEDYLTMLLPEPVEELPDAIINGWYPVFSPFATKLIFDMLNGILPMDEFKDEYSKDWLKQRLIGYTWILPFDPTLKNVDTNYVIVHPHPENGVIELTVYQYRLLERAIDVFLGGGIELNRRLVIVEEGFEHYQEDHPHPHRTWEELGLS